MNLGKPTATDGIIDWPKDWSEYVGQCVMVEGTAADVKIGAVLMGKHKFIYIDGLYRWPNGYSEGEDKGKRLRVTGTVIKRADLPVFIQKPGEIPRQGMPVETEAELKRAKWRYLLQNAKWTVLGSEQD